MLSGVGAILLLCLLPAGLVAVEVGNMYGAEVIVTGTQEPERTRGLKSALLDVFIKLTGDAGLARDKRLQAVLDDPHRYVAGIEYEDRMRGIPVHDEQGTRERPHFLRATFKRRAVDAELEKIGLNLWPQDRPLVAVWLAIKTPSGDYILSETGEAGYGQRAVLTETALRRGVPIVLPGAKQKAVTIRNIEKRRTDVLLSASEKAAALLLGVLSATPEAYWNIHWILLHGGAEENWSARKVTFDTALKDGIEKTAWYLSR